MLMKNDFRNDVFSSPYPAPLGSALWLNLCGQVFSRTGMRLAGGGYSCPHLIERGRGWITVEGGRTELRSGDMFCLLEDCVLEYEDDPADPWVFSWVHLTGSAAAIVCREMGFLPEQPWLCSVPFNAMAGSFAALRACLGRGAVVAPYEIVAALYKIVGAVTPLAMNTPPDYLTQQAEDRMDAFLHERINVTGLARLLHVDRTTLFHAFRRARGCSPVEVLRNKRVDRARQMLIATDAKLAVIARVCGFSNEKYLMRTFKEITGMTPGQFRAHHQSDDVHIPSRKMNITR